MKNNDKPKRQLINEVPELRRRIAELEASEAELKQTAKKALLDEKSKSETILAAIGDGISIQAANFRILYQNQIHKDLVGEHVGELCYKAYRQRDAICEECPLAMSFKDGEIHKVERSVTTNRGTLHIAVTASSLRNAQGEIIGGIEVVRDITKRKMAEKELDLERQQLLSIFESINEVVYVSDPHTHEVLYTNKAIKDLFGNVVGQKCYKVFQNLESPCPFCTNKHIFGKNEGQSYIWEIQNRVNNRWYRCIDKAIRWPDGRMVRYEMAIDITDRKKTEENLKLFSRAIEEGMDGIQIVDLNGNIIYSNKAVEEIYGFSADELRGKHVNEMNADKEFAGKVIIPSIKETGRWNGEIRVVHKDGREFPVWLSASMVKDNKGDPIAMVGIIRDMTEHKEAEEAIKESEEKYRMLVENIQDGVFIIQGARLKFLNEAFARMVGYTAKELIGMDIQQLIAPEDLDIVMERYRQRLTGKDVPREYEFRMLHKDGITRVIVNMIVGLVNYQGKVASMGTVKDITESKKMEEELQKAQKLESLGILAGGIAHDFNNILTAITGNISLAKMYAKPGLEIFDILTEVEKAALRAKNLTKQLLTFSKGGTPIKKTMPIAKLIKDSASFALSGSNIRCEFSISNNLWLVGADEGQISHVVNNLIINAQQAMPEGGIISISAENIKIGSGPLIPLRDGKYVKISIQDQGIGIPEEHLQKIFDPYFTTKQEGSGLGLATAYSIIKKHDGHIAAESKLGVGTTFHIYLPASEEKIPTIKDKMEVPSTIRDRGKVLVMDDDEIVRIVVGRMLGQCGYEADFAEDGAEAIELYKKAKESGEPFDAVIIDLIIPAGMGGKEVIKKLLEIDPDIKAIVSSGYSEDPLMADFKGYGFREALAKPYELPDLRQVLHRVITDR